VIGNVTPTLRDEVESATELTGEALPFVGNGEEGIANKYFYLGEQQSRGYEYGLVNIAAFLAQCMKETIKYDACDENKPNTLVPMHVDNEQPP